MLGLRPEWARAAITTNAAAVVKHGEIRQFTYRGVIRQTDPDRYQWTRQ